MFAGLAKVETEEDDNELVGISSKENETFSFDKRIVISNYQKIHQWLKKLEY